MREEEYGLVLSKFIGTQPLLLKGNKENNVQLTRTVL